MTLKELIDQRRGIMLKKSVSCRACGTTVSLLPGATSYWPSPIKTDNRWINHPCCSAEHAIAMENAHPRKKGK